MTTYDILCSFLSPLFPFILSFLSLSPPSLLSLSSPLPFPFPFPLFFSSPFPSLSSSLSLPSPSHLPTFQEELPCALPKLSIHAAKANQDAIQHVKVLRLEDEMRAILTERHLRFWDVKEGG